MFLNAATAAPSGHFLVSRKKHSVIVQTHLISDIPAKYINSEFCVPGLNCRYCPTSLAGCPLNFMQRLFADELAYLPLRVLCWLLLLALAFCRFICPLGAFYGLFNKIALLSVKLDENKCVHCNGCLRTVKWTSEKWETASAFPTATARQPVSLGPSGSVGRKKQIEN